MSLGLKSRTNTRLHEFMNGEFTRDDFEFIHMKRLVISKDGEVILDVIRPDTDDKLICKRAWDVISSNVVIKKQFYTKDGHVSNGLIARILNGMAYSDFENVLVEIVIEDNVGRSTDLFVNRVIRYVVSYHDGLCDCRGISDMRILENLGDVMDVVGR